MDPMEDFEFRPITEGLGFHKKSVNLESQMEQSGQVQNRFGRSVPVVPKNLNSTRDGRDSAQRIKETLSSLPSTNPTPALNADIDFLGESTSKKKSKPIVQQSPLPRAEDRTAPTEIPKWNARRYSKDPTLISKNADAGMMAPAVAASASAAVSASLKKESPAAVLPVRTKPLEIPFSFGASVFDAIAIIGFTSLFLASLLFVTGLNFWSIIENIRTDLPTQLAFGFLFLSVLSLYVISARSFFGQTIGDWAFDVQLGSPLEQSSLTYPFWVALRCLISVATGLVTLPILSLLFGRDIAGILSGISMWKKME